MDPHAKTLLDPKSVDTIVAQGPGYAATALGDMGHAVAGTEADLGGDEGFAARYEVRASLGEGGMGEVRVCRDARIGREVAIKVIRKGVGSRSDIHKRFLREARVQGQLEHPAIVPVYDLGRDPTGTSYFTMKRVRGQTLETLLERLRGGDEAAAGELTVRKLLTAFVSVCQAVHFAHARGVLHRDLKPANIMLGDYGEVYVLDWGLARLYSTPEDPAAPHVEVVAEAIGKTAHGQVMGTPGYMAPEQIRGAVDELDERSDVYALGTILFEILTRMPLHVGDTAERILVETLRGVDARPSLRAPELEVAPELEAICVRATALVKEARFPSARALSDAVEGFLDGDRDVVRRRELAAAHARKGAESAVPALATGDAAARARALQEVGRAIVLDPENADAARTLLQLLTEPPKELPPEARAEATASEERVMRGAMGSAAWAYASFVLYYPLGQWMGPRSVLGLWTMFVWALIAGYCIWGFKRRTSSTPLMPLFYFLTTTGVVATSVMFGSLVFLPVVAVANTLAMTLVSPKGHRPLIIAFGLASILIPFGLEASHIMPPRYDFTGDTVAIHAFVVGFPKVPTLTFLLFSNLAILFSASLFVGRIRDALHRAEERVILQSWQLRQLLPSSAHGAMTSAPPPADPHCIIRR
jgi:eukaryotic-like serine/threonine-protein kinase